MTYIFLVFFVIVSFCIGWMCCKQFYTHKEITHTYSDTWDGDYITVDTTRIMTVTRIEHRVNGKVVYSTRDHQTRKLALIELNDRNRTIAKD